MTFLNVQGGQKGHKVKVNGLFVLLDRGCSDSIIKYNFVKHLKHKFKKNSIEYEVAGGDFNTTKEVKVRFTLPDFLESKIVTHKFLVDDSTDDGIGYDAIIGRYLLLTMGINLNFKDEVIKWDQMVAPMKDYFSDIPSTQTILILLSANPNPFLLAILVK